MISDEAYWAGHKADAGTLQRMITEPTLAIEAKGYDVRNVKNRIHLLMLAEPGWSVPAGQDERRYAVFGVCDKARDEAYFKAATSLQDHSVSPSAGNEFRSFGGMVADASRRGPLAISSNRQTVGGHSNQSF